MAFRKISADKIFDGQQLLTDHVLVIDEEGRIEALVPMDQTGSDVEKRTDVLTPGFINCHCHLELSHMQGRIPEHTGLVDFVFKVVTERFSNEEEIREAITCAEEAMMAAGIVAIGDICNNASTLEQKKKLQLQYYNFVEASGWLPEVSEVRFERARQIYQQFAACFPHTSIVPHAPYSVSEKLWERLQSQFAGNVISIHNQETAFEDEFFLHGTGDFQRMYQLMKLDNSHHVPGKNGSLPSYFQNLKEAQSLILVHNTFTKQEDIDFVKRSGGFEKTFFCLCVNANQYIENALPPIELLRNNDCNIVLGTDSLASNWSLSIADEMKTIRRHFPTIPLEEMLCWATLNGAKALGFEDQLGSFEKGKKPGALLLSESDLSVSRLM